ncbi:MADS-box transcription factor 29 [Rhynchospora pubera]|uniref:MADS-box transcription factor 29 n=1 Tax=Rhynchospora pubera TaxID=906938 RepID=A0AAV8GBQ5_9POAL|nr:MADS-box transcription factor 29 [Rhynchospora pubera]KAJ4800821.1 MADS-box transcription factor 29 [Rhynchospora pubera]
MICRKTVHKSQGLLSVHYSVCYRFHEGVRTRKMGRGKIEIKRIENTSNRQVTFSKRRNGLLKKASELAVLCDAQVGVIIFSCTGKMFNFCSSPPNNLQYLIDRYQKQVSVADDGFGSRQQLMYEIERMKSENDKLEVFIKQYLGQDLTPFSLNDIMQLEQQLESSIDKVRKRKEELLSQQLSNLRRKEHILEDQNNYLYRMIPDEHAMVAVDQKPGPSAMMDLFGNVYQQEGASELPAYRLQPMQPNLQQVGFMNHGLQL